LAESLDFEYAKHEFKEGEYSFHNGLYAEAFDHFLLSKSALDNIRFFQNLTGHDYIDVTEFNTIHKNSLLRTAQCMLELGKPFSEAKSYYREYIALESDILLLSEVEKDLEKRGFINTDLTADLEDMSKMAFQLFMYSRQNRYRDIIRLGNLLRESYVVVHESKRETYADILQLIGESNHKAGYYYDAEEYYQEALKAAPGRLEVLVLRRLNYAELEKDTEYEAISQQIDTLVTPKVLTTRKRVMEKGRSPNFTLMLDGRKIGLSMFFDVTDDYQKSLLTVYFNERVVWEGFVEKHVIVPLASKVGINRVRIQAVNRTITLTQLGYE
jgi:hypothetical protein